MSEQPTLQSVNDLGNVTGAVDIDGSKGNTVSATLIGNVTLTLKNIKPGQLLLLQLAQDGTGGRSVTLAGQSLSSGSFVMPQAAGAQVNTLFQGSKQDGSAVAVVSRTTNSGQTPSGTVAEYLVPYVGTGSPVTIASVPAGAGYAAGTLRIVTFSGLNKVVVSNSVLGTLFNINDTAASVNVDAANICQTIPTPSVFQVAAPVGSAGFVYLNLVLP